jgi:KipI family sensor histidine kinase inhibitor
VRVLPCGDRAVLLDCDSLDEARSWFAALDGHAEVVLGARTVLVTGDPGACRDLVARTSPRTVEDAAPPTVRIAVTYDGDDLDDVATLTGLSVQEVVAAHTGTPWTVAFGGFAPGFSYLVGGDARLCVPRRPSPRTVVPAGSVGLASEFSGVYPRESPGGWQLIGRTDAVLWDASRQPPALLLPGTLVRFVVA